MPAASSPSAFDHPAPLDPEALAQLRRVLARLVAELNDPAVTYLLAGHCYERTHHPRPRHFPAVFALRQGEVTNLEIGPDFLAFDTELVRYPEPGELHYPGPWRDRFRATIPFVRLYQVARQVLAPAEPAATQLSYGPETVVYYNPQVHRTYPTPADINRAPAPPAAGHPLAAVLQAIAAGLPDPRNHYLVNTSYFDSPSGPVLLGALYLHTDAVRALTLQPDGFRCEVLLDERRRQWSPVRVGFAQVWQVLRSATPSFDLETLADTGGILYEAPQVLSEFARQGPPA